MIGSDSIPSMFAFANVGHQMRKTGSCCNTKVLVRVQRVSSGLSSLTVVSDRYREKP